MYIYYLSSILIQNTLQEGRNRLKTTIGRNPPDLSSICVAIQSVTIIF